MRRVAINKIKNEKVFILLSMLISIIRSFEKKPAKKGKPDNDILAIVIVVTVIGNSFKRLPKCRRSCEWDICKMIFPAPINSRALKVA